MLACASSQPTQVVRPSHDRVARSYFRGVSALKFRDRIVTVTVLMLAMPLSALSAPAATAEPPPPPPTATPVRVGAGDLIGISDVIMPRIALGSVSGRVVESGSRKPLEDLQVLAYSVVDGLIRRAFTGPDGNYTLRVPPSARGYTICFRDSHKEPQAHGGTSKTGWAPECYPDQPWSASHTSLPTGAAPVPVAAFPQEVPDVDAGMRPGGAISGKVALRHGKRAVRANLYVRSVGSPHYRHAFSTDGSGRYRIVGLPPARGGYQVCFDTTVNSFVPGYVPQCYGARHWPGFPKQTADSSTAFSPPRFPSNATAVQVRPGSVHSGVGVRVRLAGAIAGRITDRSSGAGLGDPAVRVYDRRGRLVGLSFASEGRFRVDGLPPAAADYVCVFPQRYGSAYADAGRDNHQRGCYRDLRWTGRSSRTSGESVEVVRGKIKTNVDVALRRASTLRGTVTSAATGHAVNARVSLFTADGKYLANEQTGDFDQPGRYGFTGLPASHSGYVVCASRFRLGGYDLPWLGPQCYGGARWNGARNTPPVGATRIPIGAHQHRHGLDIALPKGGVMSGNALKQTPNRGHPPARFASVSLFDDRGRQVVHIRVRYNGTWTVAGLDPGRSYTPCFRNPPRRFRYAPTCFHNVRWYEP